MSNKRGHSSTSTRRQIVYVVLQRTSTYAPQGDDHDVSCVSVHTSLAAANQAVKSFFEIDEEEEVERESEWSSWEDLVGTRLQTNSGGLYRVITQTDTQGESLVWVEKKVTTAEEDEDIEDGSETESGQEFSLDGDSEIDEMPKKKLKLSDPGEVIDLTGD